MTLRIYTDPAFCVEGTLLCPLLLPWAADYRSPAMVADPTYARNGVAYFQKTSPEKCDFIVCPHLWRDERDNTVVQSFLHAHRQWNRPIVVFCETDSEEPFPFPEPVVFRGSLRRSRRLAQEHALPAFFTDPLERHGPALDLSPRPQGAAPVIGFCGQLDTWGDSRLPVQRALGRAFYRHVLSRPGLERWLRRMGLRITRSEGKRVRHQAVGVTSRAGSVRTNFILRDRFVDGVLTLPESEQGNYYQKAHREFCNNILESDYVLCPRGGGNWSYRLYETLALGRVPVFINTDSVLPYEDMVPWKDYCVWVEGDAIETLPGLVREHHASHSEESFRSLQQRCRELWLNFLSLDGFFRHFHEHVWRRNKLN